LYPHLGNAPTRSRIKTINKIKPILIDYPFDGLRPRGSRGLERLGKRQLLLAGRPLGAQSGWVSIRCLPDDPDRPAPPKRNKKADVVEGPKAFDHVGLLVDEPPGQAGLLLI